MSTQHWMLRIAQFEGALREEKAALARANARLVVVRQAQYAAAMEQANLLLDIARIEGALAQHSSKREKALAELAKKGAES